MRVALIPFLLLALIMESIWVAMRSLGDLRTHVPAVIELLLTTSIFYLIAVYLVLKISNSSLATVVLTTLAALLFRATAWPVAPAFSDDVFRYRWEGALQASGRNPYSVRPNDETPKPFRVPAPDFKAGYGPVLELEEAAVFQLVSRLTSDPVRQAFWFKLPAAVADLGVIAILAIMLKLRGLPVERALIYAWCPLPVFEFWISGHHDSLVICLILLGLLAAWRQRWIWSFGWLSLAAAAKFWPLALAPSFARESGPRRAWTALVALPVFALTAWPYRANIVENARFMSGFVGGWRNNDSLFGLLLALTGGDLYHAKYLAFALMAALVLTVAWLRPPLEKAALAIVTGMLLISANCHPWYLTWLLPFVCFVPSAALLLWISLMPLAYAVLIDWFAFGYWNGSTAIRWYIYVPFFTAAAASRIRIGTK